MTKISPDLKGQTFITVCKRSAACGVKKLRRFFTVAYARYTYNKMIRLAEKQHNTPLRGRVGFSARQFVVLMPDGKSLIVINRKKFRQIKKLLTWENRTMYDLKQGCIYHTADSANSNPMSDFDKEIRRIAFIRLVLKKAGL